MLDVFEILFTPHENLYLLLTRLYRECPSNRAVTFWFYLCDKELTLANIAFIEDPEARADELERICTIVSPPLVYLLLQLTIYVQMREEGSVVRCNDTSMLRKRILQYIRPDDIPSKELWDWLEIDDKQAGNKSLRGFKNEQIALLLCPWGKVPKLRNNPEYVLFGFRYG